MQLMWSTNYSKLHYESVRLCLYFDLLGKYLNIREAIRSVVYMRSNMRWANRDLMQMLKATISYEPVDRMFNTNPYPASNMCERTNKNALPKCLNVTQPPAGCCCFST